MWRESSYCGTVLSDCATCSIISVTTAVLNRPGTTLSTVFCLDLDSIGYEISHQGQDWGKFVRVCFGYCLLQKQPLVRGRHNEEKERTIKTSKQTEQALQEERVILSGYLQAQFGLDEDPYEGLGNWVLESAFEQPLPFKEAQDEARHEAASTRHRLAIWIPTMGFVTLVGGGSLYMFFKILDF
eukprot:g41321.t1